MATTQTESIRTAARWRVRRGVMVFAVLVAVELVVAGAWAVYQVSAAREDLLSARTAARDARAALVDVDIDGASQRFSDASNLFDSGYRRLGGPVVEAVSALPLVGDDIDAARTLALGGRQVADAALLIVRAVQDLGGMEAFAPDDGRLPVDAVAALAAPSSQAAAVLDEVSAMVNAVPAEGLVPQVAEARVEFMAEVAEAAELVGTAEEVTSTLPAFLGAEDPRRYLFAAQNPAELRGTGGFMGAYAVLELDDGALDFSEFIRIQELQNLHHSQVPAPNADYAARYNRFGGAGFWFNINATPDFPTAAMAIEHLWEVTEGTEVDGLIAVDPLAFEALLRISGPVEVPEFGMVGAEDVVDVVANEAYGAFDNEERKQILGEIAAGALQGALAGGEIGPLAAADAVLDVAEAGHLKIYAQDSAEQRLLDRFRVTGAMLDAPGDYLAVSVNSASATKLDYYTSRDVAYDVTLRDDGSADATASVAFTNDAPTEGLPRHVIGPGPGLETGENRSFVSLFCAVGCVVRSDGDGEVGEELGHGVVSQFIEVRSGESVTVEASWHVPDAWDPTSGEYILTYQAQPTLRPTRLEVDVAGPPGTALEDGGTWSGQVEGDQRIVIPARNG